MPSPRALGIRMLLLAALTFACVVALAVVRAQLRVEARDPRFGRVVAVFALTTTAATVALAASPVAGAAVLLATLVCASLVVRLALACVESGCVLAIVGFVAVVGVAAAQRSCGQ